MKRQCPYRAWICEDKDGYLLHQIGELSLLTANAQMLKTLRRAAHHAQRIARDEQLFICRDDVDGDAR